MQIRCPECQYQREIDLSRVPASATVATCPQCGCRFHFRKQCAEAEEARAEEMAHGAEVVQESDQISGQPFSAESEAANQQSASGESAPSSDSEPQEQPSSVEEEKSAEGQAAAEAPRGEEKPAGRRIRDRLPDVAGVPWENPEEYGFFGSFYHTLLRVLFRAPDFFRGMGHGVAMGKAVVFFVLMRLLEAVAVRFWSGYVLKQATDAAVNPQTAEVANQLLSELSAPMFVLVTPFTAIFQLFFLALLYHVMLRLAQPDKAEFSVVVRVIAYSAAPCIFSVVPYIGGAISTVWCVMASFIGCKYALGLSWSRTALALAPLFILGLAILVQLSLFAQSLIG